MNSKQTFRLFIYLSILLHLLGGALYYYKYKYRYNQPTPAPFPGEEQDVLITDSDKALSEKTPPLPLKKIPPTKKLSVPKLKKKPKPITKEALPTKPKPQQVSNPPKTTIHAPKPKQESEIVVPSETEKEIHLPQEEKPPVKTENIAKDLTEPKIQEVNSLPQTEEEKSLSESKQENTSEKTTDTPISKTAVELSQEELPLTSPTEPNKESPPQEEISINSEESPDNSKNKAEPSSEQEKIPTPETDAPAFRSFFDLKQRSGNPPLTYPLRARKMKAQGSVVLIFYVTPEGLVEKIQIESFKGHRELANSVMRTLARYKFLPQQQGWVRHTVNFILDGEKVEFLKLRQK